jgi:hypothetical protein
MFFFAIIRQTSLPLTGLGAAPPSLLSVCRRLEFVAGVPFFQLNFECSRLVIMHCRSTFSGRGNELSLNMDS